MGAVGTFNTPVFNEEEFNAGTAAATQYAEAGRSFYSIEVCDEDGEVLASLPFWANGRWHEQVNTFPELRFSYPYDDDDVALFVFPNTLSLRDVDGELLRRFIISETTKIYNGENQKLIPVLGEGLLARLGRENISLYDTDGTPTAVKTIVQTWLNDHQNNAVGRQISIGSIDSAIGDTLAEIKLDKISILAGLHRLQRLVGGYILVNNNWALEWKSHLESSVGMHIRLGHNMSSVEVVTDYRSIKTQMIGVGRGVPGVGESDTEDEFMLTSEQNDGAAQAAWGLITGYAPARTVFDQGQLDDATAARLDRAKVPLTRVKAATIDLSKDDGPLDYSHAEIKIGDRISLEATEIDEIIETNIIAIDRSLDHPLGGGPGLGGGGAGGGGGPGLGGGAGGGGGPFITVSDPDAGSGLYPDGGSPDASVSESIVEDIADLYESAVEMLTQAQGLLEGMLQYLTTDADAIAALNAALDTSVLSTDAPKDLAAAPSAGSKGEASDGDHEHGILDAATFAALPASADGTLARITTGDKSAYFRAGGVWINLTHSQAP